jgi:hypothetical protein
MTFKEWPFQCSDCEHTFKEFAWDYQIPVPCSLCKKDSYPNYGEKGTSPGIATDEIPGGIEIRHAICNPDGSPKRYYSKTEIKRAANERGYTIAGDTPKPYRVNWSGQRKRIDGL